MNNGIAVMVLLNAVQFEQSLIKTIGSIVASLIVALALRRFVIPRLLGLSLKTGIGRHDPLRTPA